VCLDCGKEMSYDWKKMKIVHGKAEHLTVASLATKEAA
jgi:hypothetical protein